MDVPGGAIAQVDDIDGVPAAVLEPDHVEYPWAQCTKCEKWRKVKIAVHSNNNQYKCSNKKYTVKTTMGVDRTSCDAPEEPWDMNEEYVYND